MANITGGTRLLASSGDDEVSSRIVHRLDLPDAVPVGAEWSPFLGGFPYQGRYVLSRTFRDTGASRSGMVFSHALLARLDEIVDTPDLRPLLKLFASSDRQRPDVATVELVPTVTPLPHSDELVGAAQALVMNGRLPVVRLGHIGFDDLVVALWARLLPEVRRGFAFRLSFDPRDLVETPMPALVCTPSSLAARWSDYPMVQSVASREPASLAAAILSGHEKAVPLLEFMQEIGSQPTTLHDLRWAERAYGLNIGESTVERRVGGLETDRKVGAGSGCWRRWKECACPTAVRACASCRTQRHPSVAEPSAVRGPLADLGLEGGRDVGGQERLSPRSGCRNALRP